jgi:hypothetical protein
MTSPTAVLLERARRHGLTPVFPQAQWVQESGHVLVWRRWVDEPNTWVWSPIEGEPLGPKYPEEEPALRAALDWLDLQHPKRAWRPAPWAPVAEAVRLLRLVQGYLLDESRYANPSTPEAMERASLAVALLTEAALGPHRATSPEQALSLILDLADDRGGELGEGLREQLRRMLQSRPDEAVQIVSSLKIAAPWSEGQRVSVGHASEIDQLQIVAEVHEVTGGWTVTVDGELLEDGEGPLLWPSEAAAEAAADVLLVEEGWALAGGATPVPEAPEAEPAPWCAGCNGSGQTVSPWSRYGAPSTCQACAGSGRAA